MWQDLRLGIRTLWKNRRFAVVAVVALALGIGANTAIFSVVQAVLLRPLPYKDPDRLVVVLNSSVRHGGWSPVAPADFYDWRDQNRVFQSLAAAEAWGGNLTGRDRPEQVEGLRVSTDLFPTLGVNPLLGRTFLPDEERLGNHRVVVLGYRLWQRRFGGDPGIVGQTVMLSGENYTIAGIMPPEFRFAPFWQTKAELWIPLAFDPERAHSRSGSSLRLFARLKPGATLEHARAEMQGIARRLEREYPNTNTDRGARVTTLHEMTVGNARPALLVLAGAVAFILLIACANVANLLLTRAAGRQREMAVRLALGAGRLRLIRQLLAESVLLAAAGGAVGLVLAWSGIHALIAGTPDVARFALPRQQEIGINGTVLGFTVLLSVLTGVVFGLVPALQASKVDLAHAMKIAASRRLRISASGFLVVSEVALALMLLAGAGLMIRSFQKLHAIDPGFHPQNVMTMAVSVAGSQHAEVTRRAAFYHHLVERIEVLPGVQAASAINHLPLAGDLWTFSFAIEGRPAPAPGSGPSAVYRVILPNYFRTMGISLLAGRDFDERDTGQAPGVILINETLARRYWAGPEGASNAVGKRMKLGDARSPDRWLSVVGVVRDVKQWDWAEPPSSEMYLPYYQTPSPQSYTTLVVRTIATPLSLTSALQNEIWAIDKDLPISGVAAMEQVVANSTWQPRFSMLLLGGFAGVALVLAAVGIYGVMSYAVSQRTHEIGIRMALGARPGDVLRMVVGRGLVLAGSGVVFGLGGAFALTRWISSLLYQVSTTDPVTFAGTAVLLGAVALVACYVPARRATRVDPMVALRYE